MDVGSIFSAESGETSEKGVSMSVWQAEVALRLSECLISELYALKLYLYLILGFLRKVYGILSAQLILTVIIAGICIAVPPVKGFVQTR